MTGRARSPIATSDRLSLPKERVDCLVETSRTSHEELLFRVKHRDNWLKSQLLAQVTLLALALGVEIGGVKAGAGLPDAFALAIPISFVLAALYVVEDRLISALSAWRSELSNKETKLFGSEGFIGVFESSAQLRGFARTTLPLRLAAQLVVFLLIPLGYATVRFWSIQTWHLPSYLELGVDVVLGCAILGMLLIGYSVRSRAGAAPRGRKQPVAE